MGPGRVSKRPNWVQSFATLSRTPVEGRDNALKSLSRPSPFLCHSTHNDPRDAIRHAERDDYGIVGPMDPADTTQTIRIALLFECGLGVLALGVGWLVGHSPLVGINSESADFPIHV